MDTPKWLRLKRWKGKPGTIQCSLAIVFTCETRKKPPPISCVWRSKQSRRFSQIKMTLEGQVRMPVSKRSVLHAHSVEASSRANRISVRPSCRARPADDIALQHGKGGPAQVRRPLQRVGTVGEGGPAHR